MKQKRYLISVIAIILIIIIALILVKQQPEIFTCEELQINLDNRNVPSPDGCDEWERKGSKPVWVGGVLTNISTESYISSYYSQKLTFKGKEKQQDIIYIASYNETLPYEIGQFYKLDLAKSCYTLHSAIYSGAIIDRNLNALKQVDCNINQNK